MYAYPFAASVICLIHFRSYNRSRRKTFLVSGLFQKKKVSENKQRAPSAVVRGFTSDIGTHRDETKRTLARKDTMPQWAKAFPDPEEKTANDTSNIYSLIWLCRLTSKINSMSEGFLFLFFFFKFHVVGHKRLLVLITCGCVSPVAPILPLLLTSSLLLEDDDAPLPGLRLRSPNIEPMALLAVLCDALFLGCRAAAFTWMLWLLRAALLAAIAAAAASLLLVGEREFGVLPFGDGLGVLGRLTCVVPGLNNIQSLLGVRSVRRTHNPSVNPKIGYAHIVVLLLLQFITLCRSNWIGKLIESSNIDAALWKKKC